MCALLLPLQRGVVDTQLIAHDKEVYDIAWGGVGVFASVSADGSVRVFDLRWAPHCPVTACICSKYNLRSICRTCLCCAEVMRLASPLRRRLSVALE